jgi:biopolymer transport protein ExbB/TolQ
MRLSRGKTALLFIAIGVSFVSLLSFLLPVNATEPNSLAQFLLDKTCATLPGNEQCEALVATGREVVNSVFVYPVTIQNVMWLMFFVGFGEIIYRLQESRISRRSLREIYFPEEEDAIIQPDDAGTYWMKARDASRDEAAFLPRLVHSVASQFQTSRSINQTNTLLNSQLDLIGHAIDVKYSFIRFTMWMLPTLGFMGTVYGLMIALGVVGSVEPELFAEQAVNLFPAMIEGISVAFSTTLLGLVQSAVIVALMHFVQEREEQALNDAGQSCLQNFINKLYVKT